MVEVKEAFNIILKNNTSVIKMFDYTSDLLEPINGNNQYNNGNLFISSSMDEQSHFDKGISEVITIYEKIMGEKFDLNVLKVELEKVRKIQQGLNEWN